MNTNEVNPSTPTKRNKLSISFYGRLSGKDNILITAAVSFRFRYKEQDIYASNDPEGIFLDAFLGRKKYYKKVSVSTGLALPKMFWVNGTAVGSYSHYNDKIKAFADNVTMIYESITDKSKLTPEILRDKINKHLIKNNEQGKRTFTAISARDTAFYQFIFDCITEERQLQTINIKADSSLRLYTSIANTIQKWNSNISVSEMDAESINQFFVWFAKQNSNVNYINLCKSVLKKYLRKAIAKKLNTQLTVDDLRLNETLKHNKRPSKDVTYLSIEELATLQNATLENKQQEIVRDLFLIQSWCGGKRYSDVSNCKLIANGNGRHYIENISKKTKTYTKLPARRIAIDIWNRYENKFPIAPREAVYNQLLGVICKKLGIEKKVTSHTARRTFATIHLTETKYQLSPIDVSILGGWGKNVSTMLRYVGMNEEALYRRLDAVLERLGE